MELLNSILYDTVYHSAPIILCVIGGIFAYKANVLNIALRFLFYLTGIFWNIMDRLPAPYNSYIGRCNPIAFLLTSARDCVIYGSTPHRKLLLLWFVIGLIISALGVRKIYKNENSYVKVI